MFRFFIWQNRKGFRLKFCYDIGVATKEREQKGGVSVYVKLIQDGLDYIEENIRCEITVEELSQRAGFSIFHYYRLFHMAVGMPVMQYILRRRLLHSIYEISQGEKMIDVALTYGFETHAGFYKAFVRELGCTPTQYLKKGKVQKPYRIELLKEEHIMITKKRVEGILEHWGLTGEKVTDIYYEGTGNRNESAYYIGEKYVLKFTANLGRLKSHIAISKALEGVGLTAAVPISTLDGGDYVAEGDVYYCLTNRLQGVQLKVSEIYAEDYADKARFIGEILGQLSRALAKVDAVLEEPNLYESVVNYTIPKLSGKLNVGEELFKGYKEEFALLYPKLTRQVIHRDPNPGNLILSETGWGFIDFELSEKNVRIFDPCYAATAILSETFEAGNPEKLKKWLVVFQNIICGYDSVVKLSEEEKKAIPYVVLSNQLLALVWFEGQERFKDLYETNKQMTEWLAGVWEELRI